MPTPWLVTSPPTTSKASVASAVSTAKRCNQRLKSVRAIRNKTTIRENENRCGLSQPQRFPEKCVPLFHFQREVSRRAVCLHFNFFFHARRRSLPVHRDNRVLAGRDVFDRERAVLARHREIRMVHD